MAVSRPCANEEELNLVFKCLGERGREAELVKEYDEKYLSFLLAKLTEASTKFTEKKLAVRPYGSAAEDLKCLSPENYGDMDIMVFPTTDSFIIHEDMLEYLPENPLYVRIRASDHSVFQSCLVEGTEYLATSALKNFDSAIYGNKSSEWLDYLKYTLSIVSTDHCSPSLPYVYDWKNKEVGPAFTIDSKQWFGTTLQQLQNMTESKRGCSCELADWEGLASSMFNANGIDYTREHASVIEDLLRCVGESQASLIESGPDGFIRGLPTHFQEFISSDKVQSFITRVQAIESRKQNECGSRAEAICHEETGVTQQKCHTNEVERNSEPAHFGPSVAAQNRSDAQTPGNQDLESTSSDEIDNTRIPYESVTEQQNDREGARETIEKTSKQDGGAVQKESKPQLKNCGEKEGPTSKDATVSDRAKHEVESGEREKFHLKRWLNHLIGEESGNKEHRIEEKDSITRKRGIDLVPALRSRGWPKASRDWLERERKWPSVELVTKITDEGYHLVVKSPRYSEIPECDFRISFSHAEYLLSQEINEIQRECYRCLKKLHRAYLSSPAGLVSFHLKNLFLQTIEETGADMWTEDKRTECMMKLLENLLKALKDRDLRHFFARSYNLFGVDYFENPENLASLAEVVKNIMESPVEFCKALIHQNEDDTKQLKKNEPQQDSERAVPGRAAEQGSVNDNQGNKEITTDTVLRSPQQCGNLLPNYRYHDMQDMYLQVGKELVEKAVNGDEIHDPLERSLVKDFKEMIQSHNLQTEHFLQMLRSGWSNAYFRICLSTELEMRRRMLDAIRGDVETWKYCLRQEDLASGNEEAIANRMLDPSNEDRFDLSNIVPAGGLGQYLRMFINGLDHRTPQPAQVQTTQAVDAIPLD